MERYKRKFTDAVIASAGSNIIGSIKMKRSFDFIDEGKKFTLKSGQVYGLVRFSRFGDVSIQFPLFGSYIYLNIDDVPSNYYEQWD